MMPSPVNLSTVPSNRWTPSQRISKNRSMIWRQASGSCCSARSIEPMTSANITVTCLRSPTATPRPARILNARCSGTRERRSAGSATAFCVAAAPLVAGSFSWPQALQYRWPAGFDAPHPGHSTAATVDAPQLPQKRASGGLGWPQAGQSMVERRRLLSRIDPTGLPRRRQAVGSCLLRVVHGARLADDGDLDLARILELLLYLAGDLARQDHHPVIVDGVGRDHHTDLAAGLHRVDLVDPGVAFGDVLELAQALDVGLQRLTSGPRARPGQRVGGLDDHGLDRLRLDLVVVGLHRVGDRLRLAVAAGQVAADERVRALDLVRDRLADVVQKR